MEIVTIKDVIEAHKRISEFIHRTPVLSSQALNDLYGCELFFKCENFQKIGAFKIRGATNAVLSLSDEVARKGVITHSSGNHAAAIAQAARWRGIPAFVIMPENAPAIKKEAVAGYGAEIFYCRPTLQAREQETARIMEKTGAAFIHPYNEPKVIAGQGTAAREFLQQQHKLDVLLTPVGGGGLLSGTAISAKALAPGVPVMAAEPRGADDAYRSLKAGRIIPSLNPVTIADGLLTSLGENTFAIIKEHVQDIIRVEDSHTITAMRNIWERMKIIVEPSSAVALGALQSQPDLFRNKRVGIILSGGNVDLDHLPWGR